MSKQLSYMSIIYFLSRAFFIGFSFDLIIKSSKQDAWICVLLAYFIGFIPILLIRYISSYEPNKNLKEKIVSLFPKSHKILLILLTMIIFSLTVLSFWNLCNLITSQFLNKTPKFIIGISFLIPILFLLSKEEKVIARVSLILFYISIVLFLLSILGLIFQFQLSNFQPYLENDIVKPIFPYIGFQIFPILLVLTFRDKEVTPSIQKGYILSATTLFINAAITIGVLGAPLAFIYQYPEFHILKRSYESILTYRLENLFATQWLFDIFIFCTMGLKSCNLFINWKKGYQSFLFPIAMLLIATYLFKDNTIANTIFTNYLSILIPTILGIFILILVIKIHRTKSKINS